MPAISSLYSRRCRRRDTCGAKGRRREGRVQHGQLQRHAIGRSSGPPLGPPCWDPCACCPQRWHSGGASQRRRQRAARQQSCAGTPAATPRCHPCEGKGMRGRRGPRSPPPRLAWGRARSGPRSLRIKWGGDPPKPATPPRLGRPELVLVQVVRQLLDLALDGDAQRLVKRRLHHLAGAGRVGGGGVQRARSDGELACAALLRVGAPAPAEAGGSGSGRAPGSPGRHRGRAGCTA